MSRLLPLLLAVAVTLLVGAAVRMTPYFAGDVAVARAVQAVSPGTEWAVAYTRSATAPLKWVVAAVALAVCAALGGWSGALLFVVALVIEQTYGESSKLLFMRPRPSPTLIAVVGSPSGYSFPSTFMTFHAVVLGSIWLAALRARRGRARQLALIVVPILVVTGWACRVVVGAHWPSDVVLTTVLCVVWLIELDRLVQWVFGSQRHVPVRAR